jgi:hypothetical protein
MRQALDDVALRAVIERERDERAPRIVDAARADLQLVAELVEQLSPLVATDPPCPISFPTRTCFGLVTRNT